MDSKRRLFLRATAAALASPAYALDGARPVPIADMHSHYGMLLRKMGDSGLAADMRASGVALVAWKLIADNRWIRATTFGIEQVSVPAAGDLARHFDSTLERMKAYLAAEKLAVVRTRADVDACLAGVPGVVVASEGADFLEGRLEGLGRAYDAGLRHLQLVHYIATPVGDFQTARPTHNGLSQMGRELVAACTDKGILVDLAHCSAAALDQALAIAKGPVVWSHGWVDAREGDWRDQYGYLSRRLSIDQAKKIADRGGVVGVWGLGLLRPTGAWPVGRGDAKAYARELAALVDKIGADHVAIGTDIEGMGRDWTVNSYGEVRGMIDYLQELKLPEATIEKVACGNYARVLKSAFTT
ncbi:MAG: membrane dipeptidase [Betaproteobacteria bacterium]|nr:membrane dipeptidase [Betaproteobacteria bacterium]